MPKMHPALAIVAGGLLCGAVIAQAVPTDPAGSSPRPWKPVSAEAYPEIVGITYETIPGAASDPYNFTPRGPSWRTADLQYQLQDSIPGYVEPEYTPDDMDDAAYARPDPQVIELEEEFAEPAAEFDVVMHPSPSDDEMPSTPALDQLVG